MDIKLIDQLYIKLSPEYKTKKEVYERIKRELSIEVKTESIKRAHERYLKKKQTGQDSGRQTYTTIGQDKKTKIQAEIINNPDNLTDKELIQKHAISERAFYNYKKQIRGYLIERSKRSLNEALEYAYPEGTQIIKELKAKKKKLLIDLVETINDNSLDKDIQIAVNKAIANVRLIEKEIQTDLQVVSIYSLAEYEKEITHENLNNSKYELDKERVKGSDSNDIPNILMKLKRKGLRGLSDEEINILEIFLNENNN